MTGKYLVKEDLNALSYMLENLTHVERGERIAEAEREERTSLEEAWEEEGEVESQSVAGLVWDVVGWESPGDFASDVALTLATGGIGKVFKWIRKGYKAKKKSARLKKLAKLRKARKAKKATQLVEGAFKLVRAVPEALKFEGLDYVLWVKKNWKKIGRAYATDELGQVAGGGDPQKKNILERLSKESVGAYVQNFLRASSDAEKEQLRYALGAFVRKTGSGLKQFRRYLGMNLKRRLMTNSVYYGLRVGIAETPLSGSVVVDIATSTTGEMSQDLVTGALSFIPEKYRKPIEPAIETARKAIQTRVTGWIKSGFK